MFKKTKFFLKAAIFTSALAAYKVYVINGTPCTIEKDLKDKVVVITGASSGIGKETARYLAKQNATLVLACRNKEKTEKLIEELKQESKNENIHFLQLQLDDWETLKGSVQNFKKNYNRLDILINNAGIFNLDFQTNKQGYEQMFATNHMGHFIFTNLLIDTLKATPQSRVINVNSRAHLRAYSLDMSSFDKFLDPFKYEVCFSKSFGYPLSKLCGILFTKGLQQQFDQKDWD